MPLIQGRSISEHNSHVSYIELGLLQSKLGKVWALKYVALRNESLSTARFEGTLILSKRFLKAFYAINISSFWYCILF